MKEYIKQDESDGSLWVSIEVVDNLYKLIMAQRAFFKSRDKKLLVQCKAKEEGFIKWWQSQLALIAAAINNDAK